MNSAAWPADDLEIAPPAAPDFGSRLLTALGATVDGIVVRTARFVVDRALMPGPGEVQALRNAARFYEQGFADDPRRFFAFLDGPQAVPQVTVGLPRRLGRDGERVALTFPTAYQPANPAHLAEHEALHENRLVHAELWRHRGGRARATVVAMHGFGMGYPPLDALALMAPSLFAAGLDVALLTLPLHGARAPRGGRFSGQLFANANVVRTNEAIAQAVHDLAALIAWLRAHGADRVGALGLSLGGYLAALSAALLPDLDFAIPLVAPVCFGDLAHRFMASSIRYRARPEAVIGRDEMRAAYRVHSPLAHPPRVPRERLLIVAGRGDRVVPPEHTHWLADHWGHPRTTWFSGSHIAPFGRPGMGTEIRRFIHDVL